MKKLKPKMVIWEDALSNNEWTSKDKVLQEKPLEITDIGYIVKRDKNCIIVVNQFSSDNDYGNRTVIPRKWVKKIKNLKLS